MEISLENYFVCGSWGLRAKTGFTQQENLSQTSKQALIVKMLDNASVFNR